MELSYLNKLEIRSEFQLEELNTIEKYLHESITDSDYGGYVDLQTIKLTRNVLYFLKTIYYIYFDIISRNNQFFNKNAHITECPNKFRQTLNYLLDETFLDNIEGRRIYNKQINYAIDFIHYMKMAYTDESIEVLCESAVAEDAKVKEYCNKLSSKYSRMNIFYDSTCRNNLLNLQIEKAILGIESNFGKQVARIDKVDRINKRVFIVGYLSENNFWKELEKRYPTDTKLPSFNDFKSICRFTEIFFHHIPLQNYCW